MPSHNAMARAARLAKERVPEYYCPYPTCLYRTYNGQTDTFEACPKGYGHGLHVNAVKREDSCAI